MQSGPRKNPSSPLKSLPVEAPLFANAFRIRTYKKGARNSFRIRTYKFIELKVALFTSLAPRLIFHEDERAVKVFSNGAGGAMPEIGLRLLLAWRWM